MLHFVSYTKDEENNFFTNWYSMQLNEDFIQKLKTHGRLPEPTTNAYFDEIAKNEALLKENAELKRQLAEQTGMPKQTKCPKGHVLTTVYSRQGFPLPKYRSPTGYAICDICRHRYDFDNIDPIKGVMHCE